MASDPKRTHEVFWLLLWVVLVWIASVGWLMVVVTMIFFIKQIRVFFGYNAATHKCHELTIG